MRDSGNIAIFRDVLCSGLHVVGNTQCQSSITDVSLERGLVHPEGEVEREKGEECRKEDQELVDQLDEVRADPVFGPLLRTKEAKEAANRDMRSRVGEEMDREMDNGIRPNARLRAALGLGSAA